MKLQAEHIKVKVTQEDKLFSLSYIYIIKCYLALLPSRPIYIYIYITGEAQPLKRDSLWLSKIHNGLVNSPNCLAKPRNQG